MSSHPAWKRSYVVRAARIRRELTYMKLARRLGVPEGTVRGWLQEESERARAKGLSS